MVNKVINNLFGFVLLIIITIVFLISVHSIAPTKATVESYLKENSCNPYDTKTDYSEEYPCILNLRKHTTTTFGKMIYRKSPKFPIHPFGNFNYGLISADSIEVKCIKTDTCKNDEHLYVFVVTRDEGPLVYNPVTGKYMGTYNNLMLEMGCEFRANKPSFFSRISYKEKLSLETAYCLLDLQEQMLVILEKDGIY